MAVWNTRALLLSFVSYIDFIKVLKERFTLYELTKSAQYAIKYPPCKQIVYFDIF